MCIERFVCQTLETDECLWACLSVFSLVVLGVEPRAGAYWASAALYPSLG